LTVELVVEDVDSPLALDIRQREVGAVARADCSRDRPEDDDADDPRQHDRTTATETHLGQALQHDTSGTVRFVV
jgi:hypothetical protein